MKKYIFLFVLFSTFVVVAETIPLEDYVKKKNFNLKDPKSTQDGKEAMFKITSRCAGMWSAIDELPELVAGGKVYKKKEIRNTNEKYINDFVDGMKIIRKNYKSSLKQTTAFYRNSLKENFDLTGNHLSGIIGKDMNSCNEFYAEIMNINIKEVEDDIVQNKTDNSKTIAYTCSDPITIIRWPELCKTGFDVSFLADYFQGRYNDSSYEDYRMCGYFSSRLRPPKYEDSGKTKEEFYDGIDEQLYLSGANLNRATSDYFYYSVIAPIKNFNPSVTLAEITKFLMEDNQRIENKIYQDNTTYKTLDYSKIADLFREKCVPIIRNSYISFLGKNNRKPIDEQVKTRDLGDILIVAFAKMDKEGKVENLEFDDWLETNKIKKEPVINHINLWTEIVIKYTNLSFPNKEDLGYMDLAVSDYCIEIYNNPVCPFIDSNKFEFDTNLWDQLINLQLSPVYGGNNLVLGRPGIEYVKNTYCIFKHKTNRCFADNL